MLLFPNSTPRAIRKGPAILIQDVSTVVVEPGCLATVTAFGDVAVDVGDVSSGGEDVTRGEHKRVGTALDPVYLSIFAHRFMGIAEQMGRTLQVFANLALCPSTSSANLARQHLPEIPCILQFIFPW